MLIDKSSSNAAVWQPAVLLRPTIDLAMTYAHSGEYVCGDSSSRMMNFHIARAFSRCQFATCAARMKRVVAKVPAWRLRKTVGIVAADLE